MISRILSSLCLLCTATLAHGEQLAKMIEFKIAGGQVIKCPVTDAGPIPAESGPYKMVGAGFALGKDDTRKHLFLIFGFDLEVGKEAEPLRILVEDVSDHIPVVLVEDKTPKIAHNAWHGSAQPLLVSASSTPWIFENNPTIKIYRVTITAKRTPDIVLYQPAWYGVQAKKMVVQMANNAG